jgi:hypothetical protein
MKIFRYGNRSSYLYVVIRRVSDPDSLNPDPNPGFFVNMYIDPDPGFDDQNLKKLTVLTLQFF